MRTPRLVNEWSRDSPVSEAPRGPRPPKTLASANTHLREGEGDGLAGAARSAPGGHGEGEGEDEVEVEDEDEDEGEGTHVWRVVLPVGVEPTLIGSAAEPLLAIDDIDARQPRRDHGGVDLALSEARGATDCRVG